MNIGIFETEHFEGAYPVIKLFDKPENKLVLFTDKKTYKRFSDLFGPQTQNYEWVIENTAANRFSFFFSIYHAVREHRLDILYINTISKNHLLFGLMIKFLPPIRVVITIHDINCLFESRFTMGIRDFIRHIGIKVLLQEVNEFNVVSDTMISYLREKSNRIKIHNVPGAIFEHRVNKTSIKGFINLVVPGSIDNKRRDYDTVFDLLIAAELIELNLHITLLGGPYELYGASVIDRAKKWKGRYTRLFYYEEKIVEQNEFDKKLDSSHFIFIPSVIRTSICGDIPEIYGITKSSGNIFDVIKHAKPFIVPKELLIPVNLNNSCIAYRSLSEVVEILKTLAEFPDHYTDWTDRAITNSMNYTIEKIRDNNPSLFTNIKETPQNLV